METLLLCLEVFFARILDVSIGSVRTVYLIKQKNFIACFLAFIELLIWFYVARETITMRNISFLVVVSYALGYAVGTYMGGLVNKYLIKGNLTILIFTKKTVNLGQCLKRSGYGASTIVKDKSKEFILVEIDKKNLKKLKRLIDTYDNSAFIIINESLEVKNGYF